MPVAGEGLSRLNTVRCDENVGCSQQPFVDTGSSQATGDWAKPRHLIPCRVPAHDRMLQGVPEGLSDFLSKQFSVCFRRWFPTLSPLLAFRALVAIVLPVVVGAIKQVIDCVALRLVARLV